MSKNYSKVKVWSEKVSIPTYGVGKPDKNPMFLEKRVYQGSSGRVYPHPVTDKIFDKKTNKEYTAVWLENDFIKVMVLPEIGGRIQRATDKTNGYDFVYYNHVIKPALVGLAGPWISGGIEFNWPQHHRPSTFDPVDYTYRENEDGSATIVVGEIENMFRTKGMASFTLYPDSTYIEIKAQLFNRTDVPQTFLWWANPAVPVNDNTRSIFPPDVTAVMDHGKRAVSTFPIATGTYYKVDYSSGVDISRYKNLPVPTSYMAAKSDYDFVGGYDDGIEAGILHVADHHISPGKKQWTWGCGDFGKAWDRNLTDEDGPYVELMTGCFTDNQPDFSWLAPMEEKRFTQYFMPYKKLGAVHNATKDLAMNVTVQDGKTVVSLFATGNVGEIAAEIVAGGKVVKSEKLTMEPTDYEELEAETGKFDATGVKVVIYRNGCEYLSYQEKKEKNEIPSPAVCPPEPELCHTNEDLYLYGLHIEQYRHATYEADKYYLEGLRRDPTDIRINNAYGLLLLKRGYFTESRKYFEATIKKVTRSNPNPYDSEPYFNLGLSLFYSGDMNGAYDAFYKSAWTSACCESAFYYLAAISARRKDYELALEHAENAIIKNGRNYKALGLKTYLFRTLGRKNEAAENAKAVLKLDPLDLISRRELEILTGESFELSKHIINDNTAIELAAEYAVFGAYNDSIEVLDSVNSEYPLVWYYKAYYLKKLGKGEESLQALKKAEVLLPDYCFPHRLEDIVVLKSAIAANPTGSAAYYYLGNLYYDKKRSDDAIDCFKRSAELNPKFPTVHRNLSLAYYNKLGKAGDAVREMEKAHELDRSDARVLMELDKLLEKTGVSPKERLERLEAELETVKERDDLYLEYITLLNLAGRNEEAYKLITERKFHPWEGGEGKVPAQYVYSLVAMAKKALDAGKYAKAGGILAKAYKYPENLGEGKLFGAQENQIDYFMGIACAGMGQDDKAKAYFEKASTGLSEPASAMYYNDQPPETIFYQGMALLELGRDEEANSRFVKLVSYADRHFDDEVKIDYFAVSLPDFLVFDEDLEVKNKAHCLFMRGLGSLGKGEVKKANMNFSAAKRLAGSHFGVNSHINLFLKK